MPKSNLQILPQKLLKELEQVVHCFQNQGVNLILFGSFAEGKGRAHSDLDLAYNGVGLDPEVIYTVHEEIENLHTVRSVDLVDLQRVDAAVAEEIKSHGRSLQECLCEAACP
ncbi:nucleotidyltransferase domain-containing protein [Verrucomicrobia bacterium]|nr:nucleotidyltransferase domain-containing protein [Verrucomicrobiota bacterium]